jgi:hypothetical protein
MITKVFNEQGQLVHDCKESGCDVSWDGFVILPHVWNRAGHTDPETGEDYHGLKEGDAVPGREDPGDEWDTSKSGVARLKA